MSSEECALCRTSIANNPHLELLYSKCCGASVCTKCLASKFEKKVILKCPDSDCSHECKRDDFSRQTYDQQKTAEMAVARRHVAHVYNFSRSAFKSDEEFDLYQQEQQDIIYDLVYGSEKEKTAARSKLKKFERDNKEAIERNRAQEFGGGNGGGGGAGGMELVVPESQPIAPNNELFPAIPFNPDVVVAPKQDELARQMQQDDPETLRRLIRDVSGYDANTHIDRCRAEAWNSMWHGC